MTAVKMTMVDVITRNTLAIVRYFWYLVAFLCIMERVDFALPLLNKAILPIGRSRLCEFTIREVF